MTDTSQKFPQKSETEIREWLTGLFKSIDAQDADGFANYFAKEGLFVFGSFPEARGREAISGFVSYFFGTIKSLSHKIGPIAQANGLIYVHFDVTYVLEDGQTVTIPGLETLKVNNDLVDEYIIYMDPSKLLTLQSDS